MAGVEETDESRDELSAVRDERDSLSRELRDLRAHLSAALHLMDIGPGPQGLRVRRLATDEEIVDEVRRLRRDAVSAGAEPARQPPQAAGDLESMGERELFATIGRRPGAFLGRADFHYAAAFLNGYGLGSARRGEPVLDGWPEWLVGRRGRDCNHAWPGQVLHVALPAGWGNLWELPPEDEAHAIKQLFQLLDEFLAQRRDPPTDPE